MLKYSKWFGVLGIVITITACFLPWVYIESIQIMVSGFCAKGTNFGKPGILHIIFSTLAIAGFSIDKIWIKRANIFVCAIHIALAIKNYIIVTACFIGECPHKKIGIFLILIGSSIMMIAALFPNIIIKNQK